MDIFALRFAKLIVVEFWISGGVLVRCVKVAGRYHVYSRAHGREMSFYLAISDAVRVLHGT